MSILTRIRCAGKLLLLAGAGAIAAAGATSAWAQPGGGGGQPPRCTIDSANPVSINAGESTVFQATITRDSPPYDVTWSYPGGDDQNADGNNNGQLYEVTGVAEPAVVATTPVFYNMSGQYIAVVTATGQNGRSCNQSVTVNVGGGGQNQPPVAVDDDYTVTDDQTLIVAAPGVLTNDTDDATPPALLTATLVQDASNGILNLNSDGSFSYTPSVTGPSADTFTYNATDDGNPSLTSNEATVNITIEAAGGVTARGDSYATPIGKALGVTATRVSGVLYNDFGGTPPLTVVGTLAGTGTEGGTYSLLADGSFDYSPPANAVDNQVDTFTYTVEDAVGEQATGTVTVQILSDQPDYKMTMNYELGMHCTGFEFAYCCVLPPYNSIVAQITKPQTGDANQAELFPRLLDATEDPATKDGLGRETVLRDLELDASGNFKRYQVKYFHDAQPRLEGQGAPQGSTLISDVEGNSMFYYDSVVDGAAVGANNELLYGSYADGVAGPVAYGVWQGDGSFLTPSTLGPGGVDNYANAWLNHFYIYADLEGTIPPGSNSQEENKNRLGVAGNVEYPKNV